jgi:hypothetical protein
MINGLPTRVVRLDDGTAAVGQGEVRFQKRAHTPLLVAAAFAQNSTAIPWLGGRRLRLVFG